MNQLCTPTSGRPSHSHRLALTLFFHVGCAEEPGFCEANPGVVRFEAEGGALEDRTAAFGGAMVLDEPGTWWLCGGEWAVSLEVVADDVAIVGKGAGRSVLRGDGGSVMLAQGVEGLQLSELTLADGQGHTVGPWHSRAETFTAAGLHLSDSQASVASVTFEGNVSEGGGGGIAAVGSALQVEGSLFTGNDAGMGASIFLWDSSLTIRDTDFIDNLAEVAGGISGWPGSVDAEGLLFEGNRSTMFAGAVALITGSTGSVRQSTFAGNHTEDRGGAMVLVDGDFSLEELEFSNNTAAGRGGALLVSNSFVSLSGGDFTSNSPFDLHDVELNESRDLGLGADLVCEPGGCQ